MSSFLPLPATGELRRNAAARPEDRNDAGAAGPTEIEVSKTVVCKETIRAMRARAAGGSR
jgi:hypothetical protein